MSTQQQRCQPPRFVDIWSGFQNWISAICCSPTWKPLKDVKLVKPWNLLTGVGSWRKSKLQPEYFSLSKLVSRTISRKRANFSQSVTSRLETSRYWSFFPFSESISISLKNFGLKQSLSWGLKHCQRHNGPEVWGYLIKVSSWGQHKFKHKSWSNSSS